MELVLTIYPFTHLPIHPLEGRSMFTGYSAIVSARFRTLLQYRAAAFAGLCTQLFWGLIRVMIFSAFYRSTTAAQPMDFSQVVTYVWLGQAFLLLIPMRPDEEVQAAIRTGT